MRGVGVAVLALAALMMMPGCKAKRPGVTVLHGYHLRYTSYSLSQIADATEQVFDEQGVLPSKQALEDQTIGFTASNAQGVQWHIKIRPESGATRLAVRVEPGHDEGASLQMIDEIIAKAGG